MYLPFQAISNRLVGPRIFFSIYSKMHYGFNYVGSKHLHPSTHTKPARHGKRHDTANNTVTHIVGLLGRI